MFKLLITSHYHIQIQTKIKKINRILKVWSSKFSETFQLPRPKVLTLALMTIRSSLSRTIKLSFYVLIEGCLMHLEISLAIPDATLSQANVTEYFRRFIKYLQLHDHRKQSTFSKSTPKDPVRGLPPWHSVFWNWQQK